MRIAYLTLDEVHEALALEMATEYEIELCAWWPKDGPPDGSFDAWLVDLDYWPPSEGRKLLADLRAGRLTGPVALHGYGLDSEELAALSAHGVLAAHRLERELLGRLAMVPPETPVGRTEGVVVQDRPTVDVACVLT